MIVPKKDKEKKEQPVEETVETPEVTEEVTPEVPEVNPWEEKYNAEHDAHLRLAAEYDNFRKRTKESILLSSGLGFLVQKHKQSIILESKGYL